MTGTSIGLESPPASVTAGSPIIGIVGFGHLAQNYYAPVLRGLGPKWRFFVADPLAGSRAAAARLLRNATTYTDYRDMLERERLSAMLVASPPSTHLETWQAASLQNIPVFMEKPFLLPHELETIDVTDAAWNRLMIDFNRRFWPTYRRLGETVAKHKLGPVQRARFVLNVDTRHWSRVTNHRTLHGEGGVLHDLGSHMLDLVWNIFRQSPDEITARRTGTGTANERLEVILHFPNGVVAECDLAYTRRHRESVTIMGRNATLQLSNPNVPIWIGKETSLADRVTRGTTEFAALAYRGFFRSRSMMRYSVRAALQTFLVTVGTSRPFSPGFEDALRVARYSKAVADYLANNQKD